MSMDQQQIIEALEARAKALNVPMGTICTAAGVHPTTFSRWKKSDRNPDPIGASLKSLSLIDAELRRREAPTSEAA